MFTSSITSITGLRIERTNVLMNVNESVLNYYSILNLYSIVDIELIILILVSAVTIIITNAIVA